MNYFDDVLKSIDVYDNYNKEMIKTTESLFTDFIKELDDNFLLAAKNNTPLCKYPIEQINIVCYKILKEILNDKFFEEGRKTANCILTWCAYAGLGAYKLCFNNKNDIDIYSELTSPAGINYLDETATDLIGFKWGTEKSKTCRELIWYFADKCLKEVERIADDYNNLEDNTLAIQFSEDMRAMYLTAIFFEKNLIELETEVEKEKQKYGDSVIADYLAAATICDLEKHPDEAVTEFRKAILINPNMFEPYQIIGDICLRNEKIFVGTYWYEQALKLKPDDLHVLSQLAIAYCLSGNKKKSLETCSKFIRKGGDKSEVEELLNVLLCY